MKCVYSVSFREEDINPHAPDDTKAILAAACDRLQSQTRAAKEFLRDEKYLCGVEAVTWGVILCGRFGDDEFDTELWYALSSLVPQSDPLYSEMNDSAFIDRARWASKLVNMLVFDEDGYIYDGNEIKVRHFRYKGLYRDGQALCMREPSPHKKKLSSFLSDRKVIGMLNHVTPLWHQLSLQYGLADKMLRRLSLWLNNCVVEELVGMEIVNAYECGPHSCMSNNPNDCLDFYAVNDAFRLLVFHYNNRSDIIARCMIVEGDKGVTHHGDKYGTGEDFAKKALSEWIEGQEYRFLGDERVVVSDLKIGESMMLPFIDIINKCFLATGRKELVLSSESIDEKAYGVSGYILASDEDGIRIGVCEKCGSYIALFNPCRTCAAREEKQEQQQEQQVADEHKDDCIRNLFGYIPEGYREATADHLMVGTPQVAPTPYDVACLTDPQDGGSL